VYELDIQYIISIKMQVVILSRRGSRVRVPSRPQKPSTQVEGFLHFRKGLWLPFYKWGFR